MVWIYEKDDKTKIIKKIYKKNKGKGKGKLTWTQGIAQTMRKQGLEDGAGKIEME